MKILKFMQSVPAGTLNVPMVITAIVHTAFPGALSIGGATTALFSDGTMTLIGMMLFLTGSQFRLRDVVPTLKRGFVLLIAKLALGAAVAVAALNLLGMDGFWGIPTIAIVGALASTNPGIYLAICNKQGDDIDKSAFGLLNLISVPAIPILFMGAASGQGFDVMVLVATIVPFLAGMLVGNLDPDLRGFLRPGSAVVLPFLGFCFGAMIDLRTVFSAGLSGLALTALFVAINVPVLVAVDRFILRRPGYGALGVGCAAGVSIAVPGIYAATHPAYQQYAGVAAAQIAMVVVLTSFLMPFLARYFRKAPGVRDETVERITDPLPQQAPAE